jgi:hypothetical protein
LDKARANDIAPESSGFALENAGLAETSTKRQTNLSAELLKAVASAVPAMIAAASASSAEDDQISCLGALCRTWRRVTTPVE